MQNKHVLICGGTGGLGTAVTRAALRERALITIPYITDANLEQFRKDNPNEMNSQIRFVKADLMKENEVQKLVNGMPRIDVLIQLVGGFAMGDTSHFSLKDWEWQISLNLTTTFLLCKHSLPRMREHNYGRIITIGSRVAIAPAGKMGAYIAAKSAVLAFTKSLAEETKGTGITANSVVPGTIDTQANRKTMGTSGIDKWVKPESVAELICFLASEQAAEISGADIPIYGDS